MHRTCILLGGITLLALCPAGWADLVSGLSGLTGVSEIGTGRPQSDHEMAKLPVSMFTLGPNLAAYPYGIGPVASSGVVRGLRFDLGLLGVEREDDSLVADAISTLGSQADSYYSGWSTWYGQGDIFLAFDDSAADVESGALLSH